MTPTAPRLSQFESLKNEGKNVSAALAGQSSNNSTLSPESGKKSESGIKSDDAVKKIGMTEKEYDEECKDIISSFMGPVPPSRSKPVPKRRSFIRQGLNLSSLCLTPTFTNYSLDIVILYQFFPSAR